MIVAVGAAMKLSVIIPCLNEEAYLGVQLEALANQQWSEPWEVIVADNGSTDRSPAIVEQYRGRLPNLRLVDASDRRGQAHARNVGARIAAGTALAFCDADDEVAPGWLSAMGQALSEHDFVAGRFADDKLNADWVRARRRAPQRDGLQVYQYAPYLLHAGGSSIGIKRALHEAVGGFDETWLLLEDMDYCFRIQLAGTKLHFVPDALIQVRLAHTFNATYRQGFTWGEYDVLLYKKYRSDRMPKFPLKEGIGAWVRLILRIPQLRSKSDRIAWLSNFARRFGRLRGCIKYRVLAP
jgi:glycosyltransferase involved in cell wall biosynthesis